MKKTLTTILSLVTLVVLAQAPQNISYQAIARQVSGAILPNQPIGVEFKIYQTSTSGTLVYSETHNATTNGFGLFSLFIGGGTPSSGTFSAINWSTGNYWVETSIDPTGGTSYTSVGAQQLMSVPYALYAETSGNSSATPTININAPNTVSSPSSGIYNISVPSYSAGAGISIASGVISNTGSSSSSTITGSGLAIVTPSVGNNFTINVPAQTLSVGSGSLSISGGNSIALPASQVLSISANTLTLSGGGGAITLPPQTLSLSGNTLTSGVASNSVNLALLPSVWTKSLNNIYQTTLTDFVGIGTPTPNNTFQVKDYVSFENNGSNTLLGHNTTTLTSSVNGCYANTFVGYDAGGAIINNANNNTFMGWHSGVGNSNGASNTFFGSNSGTYNTSGNNNTFLGTNADLQTPTQRTNATAIGYNAKVDTNDAIILGSPGVNVGIGTTKPASSLHVTNNVGSQIRFGHNNQPTLEWFFDVSGTSHLGLRNENYGTINNIMDFDPIQGNVGIGNTNPLNKLSVISSATNAALYVKSNSTSPVSAQFVGDVIVFGKTLTDSISISGPGSPTVGSVLVSRDNLGNAKWSGPVIFKAIYSPSSIITVNGAVITGIGNTSGYSSSTPVNVGGGLSISASNMIFTAPVTGYYNLNATMLVSLYPTSVGNAYVYLELFNNTTSTTIARAHSNGPDASIYFYTTLQVNTIAQLTQGQQVILRVGGSITNSGTITNNYSANLINQFSGSLIR